jgi:hypothetical protein
MSLTAERKASVSHQSSSSNSTVGCNVAAGSNASSQAAADPLGQLLQQFAEAVSTSTRATAAASNQPVVGQQRQTAAALRVREIKTPAKAAAASGSSMIGSDGDALTSIVLPQKQRQGKNGAAAGRVLVQVLASSDDDDQACGTAAAAAAAEAGQAADGAAAEASPVKVCETGFIVKEAASTRTKGSLSGSF